MTQPLGTELEQDQLDRVRRALDGIMERVEQYEQARQYDSQNLWEADQDTREGQILRQVGQEYDVNYSSPVINAVANGMIIDGVMATRDTELGDDGQPIADEQATATVNAIWRAQQLGEFWPTWQRNGLRDGDAYVMLWPTADADLEGELIEGERGVFTRTRVTLDPEQLNITYVDPLCSRLFYNKENPRIKDYFAYYWTVPVQQAGDKRVTWRLNIVRDDVIERYESAPTALGKEPKAEDFGLYQPDDDEEPYDPTDEFTQPGEIVNPFGIVPVWHLRTDVNYGQPVHLNAYAPQDAISEIIEKMLTTMNFQAWPQAYAIQEAERLTNQMIREDPLAEDYDDGLGDFDDDIDRDRATDGSDISNETGSDLTATPGGFMVLKGFKTVGQLQAADPTTFLEPWREFAKAASDTTDTPPWTFRAVGAEIPSGVALKIASAPQTARRARCALLFGNQLGDMLAFAAELCGAGELEVTVKWAPFEIVDETERWTLVKLRTDAGVPLKEALIMAGIPATEAEKWANEKIKADEQAFQRQQTLAAKQPPEDKPPAAE